MKNLRKAAKLLAMGIKLTLKYLKYHFYKSILSLDFFLICQFTMLVLLSIEWAMYDWYISLSCDHIIIFKCQISTVINCFRPYDGKWSKSMVGYGTEDDHFVLELTYNYGIGNYRLGNDFQVSMACISYLIRN